VVFSYGYLDPVLVALTLNRKEQGPVVFVAVEPVMERAEC